MGSQQKGMTQTANDLQRLQLADAVLMIGGAEDDLDGSLDPTRRLGAPDLAKSAAADHPQQPIAELRRENLAVAPKRAADLSPGGSPASGGEDQRGLNADLLGQPGRSQRRPGRRERPFLLHLPFEAGKLDREAISVGV